jgi:large subunit ribosomal protein L30
VTLLAEQKRPDVHPQCLAVVRIRGSINVRSDVKETLKMLNITRPNHATIIPVAPTYLGMLKTAKDHITWGEISVETIAQLLRRRGETVGGEKFTEEHLKKSSYKTINGLAEALHSSKVKLKDLSYVRPVFRLHPPSGGFRRTIKRSFSENGELGYRGDKINDLLNKMM